MNNINRKLNKSDSRRVVRDLTFPPPRHSPMIYEVLLCRSNLNAIKALSQFE